MQQSQALPQYPVTGEYPIHRTRFREWCDANGLGGESRQARNRRRLVYDRACRPNRILSGKAPKSGPPKGRPDRYGQRHYWTLEECRNGGRKSGDMRRWRNRERDNEIISLRLNGNVSAAVAKAIGVCIRTVKYVMSRYRVYGRPFVTRPQAAKIQGCNEQSAQQMGGIGENGGWVNRPPREGKTVAGAGKNKKKKNPAGKKAVADVGKPEAAADEIPAAPGKITLPSDVRRHILVRELNLLHFRKLLSEAADKRFISKAKLNIGRTEREISAYGKPLRKAGLEPAWKALKRNSRKLAQQLWESNEGDLMACIRQLPLPGP